MRFNFFFFVVKIIDKIYSQVVTQSISTDFDNHLVFNYKHSLGEVISKWLSGVEHPSAITENVNFSDSYLIKRVIRKVQECNEFFEKILIYYSI